MELTIIAIAVGLIIAVSLINVFVVLNTSQKNANKLEAEIKDSIRAYLDMMPLLMLTLGEDKKLNEKRESWYSNWNSTQEHWPIWQELHKEISEKISKHSAQDQQFKETLARLSEKEAGVQEAIHEYNSFVIQYNEKLRKRTYKVAKTFSGKSRKKAFSVLSDS